MDEPGGSGPETRSDGPVGSDGSSHPVRRLLRVISALTVLPFVFVWAALKDMWASTKSRSILIAGAWLLAAGTLTFMIIESLSPLDAFYFSFITVTTIGYGDIAPQTDLGKTAVVIYGLVGLGVFGAFIATLAAQRPRRRRRQASEAHENG